jgi:uncharacterized protein (TIGR00297 family)
MRAMQRWAIALPLAAAVAVAARQRGALSTSGALGAAGVGASIFGAGGPARAALLLLFFGSSTALSRLSERADGTTRRGPRRTLIQVLANGGVPALLALCGGATASRRLATAYAGALAAANADTWATEIGALSPTPPRMIVSGRRAVAGESGGVTPLGTLASLAGAALIGGVHATLVHERPTVALRVAGAGVAGALADSLLGATAQVVYLCHVCGERTENPAHTHDGAAPALRRVRGLPLMTNDTVNLCASLTGAALGAVLA